MLRSTIGTLNVMRTIGTRRFTTNPGNAVRSSAIAFICTGIASAAAAIQFNGVALPFAVCDPNFAEVRKELVSMIDAEEEKRGDGTSIAGTLIRLAWHTSGTYSAKDKTGGSNGATQRFEPEAGWGANAGLHLARNFVAPLKVKYNLTYADLYTFAGVVAVESMGGPKINWRSGEERNLDSPTSNLRSVATFMILTICVFIYLRVGRTDSAVATTLPNGRLPDPDRGCPVATTGHLRDIFGRMGFTDREIVALSGAHSVGRCHTDASGYWGPWSNAETAFSNKYFRLLLEEKWTLKRTHEGKPWTGPVQFESLDSKLMMLPSDIALVQDAEFRKYVEMYAKDEALFFKDFSAAFAKLLELGVPFPWSSTRV